MEQLEGIDLITYCGNEWAKKKGYHIRITNNETTIVIAGYKIAKEVVKRYKKETKGAKQE